MAFVALLSGDRPLRSLIDRALRREHSLAGTPSWSGFERIVRERPATLAVVDVSAIPAERYPGGAIVEFRSSFPNLGLILLSRRDEDPVRLFHLGRAGISHLILLGIDELDRQLPVAVAKTAERSASALVTRSLRAYLPRRELKAVRIAMDGLHHRWSADDFASVVGLSRPFLSERLKASRLPSAGHLLVWVRLLHAGFWLEEPGRTGESVSRQLEYSSGAAFRRALRLYTSATPGEVIRGGGLSFVLSRFREACGIAADGPAAAS
jgi:AraC-like DNA-binding protein